MQNDECRIEGRTPGWRHCFLLCILHSALCICLLAGCSRQGQQPASRPSTARDRQDQALRDPFGYSPDVEGTDISGGGLSGFDRDGFRKDMKNVLDP